MVENYGNLAPHKFNGKIEKVTVDTKKVENAGKLEKDKVRQTTLMRALPK